MESATNKYMINQNVLSTSKSTELGVLEIQLNEEHDDIVYLCRSVGGDECWYPESDLKAQLPTNLDQHASIDCLESVLTSLKAANESGQINDTIWHKDSANCTLFDYLEISINELKQG